MIGTTISDRNPMRYKQLYRYSQRHLKGFTLLEVMVVVSILAVLAALAAPSFTPMIERWRVRQAVEATTSMLYYARSEGVKRGGNVVIRKQATGTDGCTLATTDADWGCGWVVFVDTNGNGSQQSTEETLQIYPPTPRVEVTVPGSGGRIRVDRWGKMDGLNAKAIIFVPQDKNTSDIASAAICVASGGRIRTVHGDGSC